MPTAMRRWGGFLVRYWLPVVAWAGLIFALSSIPSLESGLPKAGDLVLRKLGHIIEYAVLTLLLRRALRAHGLPPERSGISAAALALLYAGLDEYHQSFVPGREGSPRDVLIDALGIGAALYLLPRGRSPGR